LGATWSISARRRLAPVRTSSQSRTRGRSDRQE
jgi:hypothetical protein